MPFRLVFHKRRSLALYGIQHNQHGLLEHMGGKRFVNRIIVVTVHVNDVPAKGRVAHSQITCYAIRNFQERADGFFKVLREHGISTSQTVVHQLSPSMEGAMADMLALLDAGEQPRRCYFADDDLIAMGAMRALRQKGLSSA